MTRDEAIKIVTLSNPTPYPRAFVQALEALGVLKIVDSATERDDLLDRACCWEANKHCLSPSLQNIECATALIKDLATALRSAEK